MSGFSTPVIGNQYIFEKGFPHGFFCNLFHLRPTVNVVVQVVGWVCRVNNMWALKTEMQNKKKKRKELKCAKITFVRMRHFTMDKTFYSEFLTWRAILSLLK